MAVDKLVPTANATNGGILSTNDYTLIDETVASADGSVNATGINDLTGASNAATWSSLSAMSNDISSTNSATFRVRARVQSISNDNCTYRLRLTVGGDTHDITFTETDTAYSNKTAGLSGGAGYPYTRAQYEAATVALEQTAHTKNAGPDDYYLEIDAFELEVDYNVTSPVTVNVTGVAGTGSPGTVTLTADAAVDVSGVAGTGQVGTVTTGISRTVPVTGVSATGAVGSVTVAAGCTVSVTGVAGTGQVGSATVSATANVAVSGVAGATWYQGTYIDGSDVLNDEGGVWTDDSNAVDGNNTTFAYTTTTGSSSTNRLLGGGTPVDFVQQGSGFE